jgi:hypothetical protein
MISEFLTELDCELKHGSENVWVLRSDLLYASKLLNAKITVPAGFETDFASVPRVPVIYWFWGGRSHRESVIHDYLFRIDAVPDVSFNAANDVFFEAMRSRDKSWYVRYPMFWGVSIGSRGCFKKRNVANSL